MMVPRLARKEKIVEGSVPRNIVARHNATRARTRRNEELVAAKRQQKYVTFKHRLIQVFKAGS